MSRIYLLLLIALLTFTSMHPLKQQEMQAGGMPPPYKFSLKSLEVYYCTLKMADKYNVPYPIAFGVLRKETNYRYAVDPTYDPYQVSSADAYGPAQVRLPTARWVAGTDTISANDLRYNIPLNIEISMKFLNQLHDKYQNWGYALGEYNTGKYKVINQYAKDILLPPTKPKG